MLGAVAIRDRHPHTFPYLTVLVSPPVVLPGSAVQGVIGVSIGREWVDQAASPAWRGLTYLPLCDVRPPASMCWARINRNVTPAMPAAIASSWSTRTRTPAAWSELDGRIGADPWPGPMLCLSPRGAASISVYGGMPGSARFPVTAVAKTWSQRTPARHPYSPSLPRLRRN